MGEEPGVFFFTKGLQVVKKTGFNRRCSAVRCKSKFHFTETVICADAVSKASEIAVMNCGQKSQM